MSGATTTQQNSHEPKDSKFKQQALPAWQPILTAGTVLPTFFVIGVAFIPIGVGLMYFSNQVKEVIIDYTSCKDTTNPELECAKVIQDYTGKGIPKPCKCSWTLKQVISVTQTGKASPTSTRITEGM